MPRFTSANARDMAALSHAARKLARQSGEVAAAFVPQSPQVSDDPLASKLSRVQEQLVAKMLDNGDTKAISMLARSFRDVREAYHLVTGQAKPGVIRETKSRRDGREKPYSQPTPVDEPETPQAKTYDGPENG